MTHVNSQSFFLVRAPTSVAISRRRLRELISTWHVRQDDDSDMAMTTVVSELVTNAVSHGAGDMLKVVVRADIGRGRLTIEVHDDSPTLPQRRTPCPDAESGRGMVLVEHLAIAYGAENTARGKRVWAELALPPRRTTGRRSLDPLRSAAAAIARRLPAFAWLRRRLTALSRRSRPSDPGSHREPPVAQNRESSTSISYAISQRMSGTMMSAVSTGRPSASK
ncbi:ATP-binding protein [Streptomyces microflavus]|uniref:ATP-binding protein n=1 Tax=Streptomyces microflavus TaxID=1919 RepID=UPI00381BB6FF